MLQINHKLSYKEKLGLAASSVSLLYMMPAAVQGAIVHDTTSFTVTNSGSNIDWDIDGDSNIDFYFDVFTSTYIQLESVSKNGRGVVISNAGSNDDILALSTGFLIGPTLATGYKWALSNQFDRTMTSSGSIDPNFKGASGGSSNYFGFRFDNASGRHYGWARVTVSSGQVVVNEWAYEDTANTCIAVGQTTGSGSCGGGGTPSAPVSASVESSELAALSGLSLLALGAAGLRRRRKLITN